MMLRFVVVLFLVISCCYKSLVEAEGKWDGKGKAKICHYKPWGIPFRLTACQICMCDYSKNLHCEQIHCPKLHCRLYRTPNGQCCPVCIECPFGGVTIQHGNSISPNPCVHCTCRYGQMYCSVNNCNGKGGKGIKRRKRSVPSKSAQPCRHPIFEHDQCCPTCHIGKDEICEKIGGFCVKRNRKGETAKFGYPIGKCEDKGTCYPLPPYRSEPV